MPFYFNTTSEVGPRVKLQNCVTRAGKIFFALDRRRVHVHFAIKKVADWRKNFERRELLKGLLNILGVKEINNNLLMFYSKQ